MKRLNNKGFAITTIVYGLAIMSTMILTLVMSLLATTRRDNNNLATEIEAELNRFSKTSVIYDSESVGGQEFIVPEGQAGWYRIELWGAQGNGENGGLGAYTSGIIRLEEGDVLYFVVGKNGTAGKGGEATDVRVESTNSATSINSRIMVAAGGGANAGAAGGTLVGYNSSMLAPGALLNVKDGYILTPNTNLLGYTQNGASTSFGTSPITQSGTPGGHPNADNAGGEGYITSTNADYGGVSFISGYLGSKAYDGSGLSTNAKYTYAPTGRSYYFIDGIMLPGIKEGAGQAKIERIASSENVSALPRLNPKLDDISAVRDCVANTNAVKNINSISVAVNGDTMTAALASDTSKSGYTCKVLNLGGTYSVDEIAVFHTPGFDYKNHTIEVNQGGTWKYVKNAPPESVGYEEAETETATGIHISAYQPDYTTAIPESGNYYIFPVTAEGQVISGHEKIDDRSNPLEIEPLLGELRQKWSIELIDPESKLKSTDPVKKTWIEYKIVELTSYNALTIYKDENMEGNQLILSSFNNLARNEPAIWKVTPMGDGTVTITSSAPTFTTSKNTGNIYVQTNPSVTDHKGEVLIGINTNKTQRFKLVKLDY